MAFKSKQLSALSTVQIILAAIAVAGIVWLAWTAMSYRNAQNTYNGLREAYASESNTADVTPDSIDFDALTSAYPNIVAWIHFDAEETAIDYPVVQGTDNELYLTTDATNTSSRTGAIFLDYRNNSFADDLHTIIYGHNMIDNTMFGGLHKFDDEDFFNSNPSTFWVATPEGTYYYQIFAVSVVTPESDVYTVGYKNTDVFEAFVQELKSNSIYDTGVSVSGQDRVLTLSTCSKPNRLVISAKLIERN